MIIEFFLEHLPLPHKLKATCYQHLDKLYFLAIGATAAGVHWLIATASYYLWLAQQHIFIANTLGFIVALAVSVWGHTFLTFRKEFASKLATFNGSKQRLLFQSMARQALVGLGSFALNNLLLYTGNLLHIYFPVLLFIVLLLVAIITFLVSKYWVYRNATSD